VEGVGPRRGERLAIERHHQEAALAPVPGR
jgi:hypothetical protein